MEKICLIGFGEAGRTLGSAWPARVFDIKTTGPARGEMIAAYAAASVTGADSMEEAGREADVWISLVTADQAPEVAKQAAGIIKPGALYCDLNSVAPDTKRVAAALIDSAGAHYIDVAVMAPVHPAALNVPILISGSQAARALETLASLGFGKLRVAGDDIGRASAIKMIRSVMVKGLEALTAEWILAAHAAGVVDEVVPSMNISWPGIDWAAKADYNLERMLVHGLRRAAEMEEAVKTLDNLGIASAVTRGTVAQQRAMGALGLRPAEDLTATVNAIIGAQNPRKTDKAA